MTNLELAHSLSAGTDVVVLEVSRCGSCWGIFKAPCLPDVITLCTSYSSQGGALTDQQRTLEVRESIQPLSLIVPFSQQALRENPCATERRL